MKINTEDGYRFVCVSDSSEISDAVRLVSSEKANGIKFNFIRNWPRDLRALNDCPQIQYLHVCNGNYDVSIVDELQNIESLRLGDQIRTPLSLEKHERLKYLSIFWYSGISSFVKCSNLQKLFLGKYRRTDLVELRSLINLSYLRLNTGSVKSLEGISNLKKLRSLWLMQLTKLESLDGVQDLKDLEELHVMNCKNITSANQMKKLPSLNKVLFQGTTDCRYGYENDT